MGQADGLTIYVTDGSYDLTGYRSQCSSPIADSSWTGIGGWNLDSSGDWHLVQDGTSTNGTTSNYPWEEWIIGQGTTKLAGVNQVFIETSAAIPTGDQIEPQVYVNTSQNYVAFNVYDSTRNTNYVGPNGPVTQNGNNFYDPSTADFIDERNTVNGSYAPLYRWYNSNVLWTSAANTATATNGQTYDANPFWNDGTSNPNWVQMWNGADELTQPLQNESLTSWLNVWNACT